MSRHDQQLIVGTRRGPEFPFPHPGVTGGFGRQTANAKKIFSLRGDQPGARSNRHWKQLLRAERTWTKAIFLSASSSAARAGISALAITPPVPWTIRSSGEYPRTMYSGLERIAGISALGAARSQASACRKIGPVSA